MKRIAWIAAAYIALCILYYIFLTRFLPEQYRWYIVAVAALLMLLPVGVMSGIRYRLRELRLIGRGSRPSLQDGQRVALSGVLRPENDLIRAPFTGNDCLSYSYGVYYYKYVNKNRKQIYEYAGKAQAPCVFWTNVGNVRLLSFMHGEETKRYEWNEPEVQENAVQYLQSTSFEEQEKFDWTRPVAFLKEVITESNGAVRKDWRMTDEPLNLEGRYLEETLVQPGKTYSIIGIWDAQGNGLKGDPLGKGAIAIYEGNAAEAAHTIKSKIIFSIIIGLILVAFLNFFVYGFFIAK